MVELVDNKDHVTCDICDTKFEITKYGGGKCPNCDLFYEYDEFYSITFTEHQKKILKSCLLDNSQVVDKIKQIQSGEWDKDSPRPPKGELAKRYWNDVVFKYGMEYGAIVILMDVFNVTQRDLSE